MESIININKVKRRRKIVIMLLNAMNNPLGKLLLSNKFYNMLGNYVTHNCVK